MSSVFIEASNLLEGHRKDMSDLIDKIKLERELFFRIKFDHRQVSIDYYPPPPNKTKSLCLLCSLCSYATFTYIACGCCKTKVFRDTLAARATHQNSQTHIDWVKSFEQKRHDAKRVIANLEKQYTALDKNKWDILISQ